jgi:hypothetical protein
MSIRARERDHDEDDDLLWPPAGDGQSALLELETPTQTPRGPSRLEPGERPARPSRWGSGDDGFREATRAARAAVRTGSGGLTWLRAVSRRAGWTGIAAAALGFVVVVEAVVLLLGRPGPVDRAAANGRPPGEPQTIGTTGASPASSARGGVPAGASGAAAVTLGIRTDPPGAAVTVDGIRRGTSPVDLAGLAPGDHQVILESPRGIVRQTVHLEAGGSLSLVVPLAIAGTPGGAAAASRPAAGGWVVVSAPLELRVLEDGRLLGTSSMQRVPVDRGAHRLLFKNEEAGFESERTVTVSAGKATTISVEVPTQRVAVNASPWAEVTVDGRRVGETPIGGLQLPIGVHILVFRHPELGEKTTRVIVRADEPARIGVDMTK